MKHLLQIHSLDHMADAPKTILADATGVVFDLLLATISARLPKFCREPILLSRLFAGER